jgi:SAM-dependent methyltransferase
MKIIIFASGLDSRFGTARLMTWVIELCKFIARRTLPFAIRRSLWAQWGYLEEQRSRLKRWWAIVWLRHCSLRLKPIRPGFGFGHGQCIDRYYMETFLERYATDIRGHVLEIADATYTRRFGGQRVSHSDVLHVTPGHPRATITADLTCADHIRSETFDCVILTQTLQYIYEVRIALRTLYRILKPGGVILATFPGISQIARYDMERWGEYWRFTTLSSRQLFAEVFPEDCVTVQAYGNIFTAIAFLHGLVVEELRREELDYHDRDYEMLITVRAMKPQR